MDNDRDSLVSIMMITVVHAIFIVSMDFFVENI